VLISRTFAEILESVEKLATNGSIVIDLKENLALLIGLANQEIVPVELQRRWRRRFLKLEKIIQLGEAGRSTKD
jgi:hypothetical protein